MSANALFKSIAATDNYFDVTFSPENLDFITKSI